MGYTLSFDASAKVKSGEVKGLLHHVCRDVDKANGCEVRHSNEGIDAARTDSNVTLYPDGSGGWLDCLGTEQVMDVLDRRLAGVKSPLRKDAVVLRPLILQLDPEWYKAHEDPAERERAAVCMMNWAEETFGYERLVYMSIHNDENAPHLHVGFCPVTDDGRLSQKDWFSGPSALREMHQQFREYMADEGYDIDMGRRKPGKHAKRMSVDEYKDFKQLEEARKELEAAQADLQLRVAEADQREIALDAREKAVKAREDALSDVEAQKYQEALKTHPAASQTPTLDAMQKTIAEVDAHDVRRDYNASRFGRTATIEELEAMMETPS